MKLKISIKCTGRKIIRFFGELKEKYDEDLYEGFSDLFCSLPLGHILNKKTIESLIFTYCTKCPYLLRQACVRFSNNLPKVI